VLFYPSAFCNRPAAWRAYSTARPPDWIMRRDSEGKEGNRIGRSGRGKGNYRRREGR